MLNSLTHCPVEYCKGENFRDLVLAGFSLHIFALLVLQYFLKSIVDTNQNNIYQTKAFPTLI